MRRRRRTALNEAVHELRRPLQALALSGPAGSERSLQLAATALERLDREINGGAAVAVREPLAVARLLEESAARWGAVAAARDRRLVLRHGAGSDPGTDVDAGPLAVSGDRFVLAQALDNLLVNAIEHGGPRIVLSATATAGVVRISVRDCARPLAAPPAKRSGRAPGARLLGASRHGHGLRVVRRAAAAHGGRFELRRSAGGAAAVLELPLAREASA